MNFNELKLPKPILTALREQGYTTPTPIQAQAIPPALEGRDVLGCAQTGTGKTCAFATPILTRLAARPNKAHPIRALVLTPTRELAIQNQDCFVAYSAHLPLRSTVIFGGVGQAPQVEALKNGTDILVATPGRLADLYQQGHIDLTHLEVFVLDEADRMLDMGFIHDVKKILKWLPEKKQTLFFSATMPKEVQSLVDQLLHDPARIAVDPVNSTVDAITQALYRTDKSKKTKLLIWLLKEHDYPSVLVFTRTKHGANRVARDLERAGIPAAAIHGNKSQTARQAALAGFKAGQVRVLVATDIAARGLDIEKLSCVINYNLPDVPETYVHRIGRTGRAGQDGISLSFCDISETDELNAIQRQLKRAIPEVTEHPYPMEEMEAPMKDKHGKRINPEDAEARAAARERSAQRKQSGESKPGKSGKSPSKAPKAEKKEAPKPAAKPEQSAPKAEKPLSKDNRRKQPKKSSIAAEEPILPPEEDVGNYEDWVRHRASTRPPVRKPYSPDALDELLSLPDFADELGYSQIGKTKKKKSGPLSGGKVMDATARMFMKGSSSSGAEEPAPEKPSRPERSRRGGRGSAPEERKGNRPERKQNSTPAPVKSAPRAETAEPSKGNRQKRRKGGDSNPKPYTQSPRPPKNTAKKQSKRPAPAPRTDSPAEAGKSLIRPYYLSDKKGG